MAKANPDKKTFETLNKILERELAGVVRYTHYSFMIYGYNRIPIVSWFRKQAQESLMHAEEAGELLPQALGPACGEKVAGAGRQGGGLRGQFRQLGEIRLAHEGPAHPVNECRWRRRTNRRGKFMLFAEPAAVWRRERPRPTFPEPARGCALSPSSCPASSGRKTYFHPLTPLLPCAAPRPNLGLPAPA